ncbi:MAG: rhodanese-like domain-containing protein [Labilithrix sp.]|nr:rhodanese-like domain-containing protein [Labilithrix sp.]
MTDSLIPPIGAVPQPERMFRVNWVANLKRTPSGVPFVTADFTAKQGRRVRIIDVRAADELTGALGYIPGSDWIPLDRVAGLVDRVDRDEPVILISGGEERSHDAAAMLAKRGMRFVAFMVGGLMSWRDLGYSTTRDPSILDREDQLRSNDAVLEPPSEDVTAAHVQKHVGDRLSVRWIKLPALLVRGLVSCVDGRDDSGVVGSPGGDAGELLVGLRALEKMLRRDLSEAEVGTLLARRLDVFGRFYMHTDVDASNVAIKAMRADPRFEGFLSDVNEALEWRRFLASPPREVRTALLEHSLEPSHIGCGHLRLALTRSKEYDTREALVAAVLRSFHQKRWEGAPELEVVALAGGHTERAVINVRIAGPMMPFSRIPLVSPAVGGAQVFVHHPRVTSYLREQLAHFLAMQTDVTGGALDASELHVEMERLGGLQLGRTLGALAKGLPIYDVTFHGEERVEVTLGGVVGE